jgi:alkylhydroperoxidase family enzyme
MKTLLQQTREECTEALATLSQYLSSKQQEAFARYMDECLRYISDHTSTRRKARSDKMEQYFCDDITNYRKQSALRIIKQAVLEEHNAAAALALEVKRLQRDGIMRSDIRPLTQFIAIVNATFGSTIKHDTFSKHFR